MAILLQRLHSTGSAPLAFAALAACWILGLTNILLHPEIRTSEAPAARWAAQYPNQIETDETTRRHLALVPAAADFGSLSTVRPMLVIKLDSDCRIWAGGHLPGKLQLVARAPFSLMDRFSPGKGGNLCLFRYEAPVSPDELANAVSAR